MNTYDCPTCGAEMELTAKVGDSIAYLCPVCKASVVIHLQVEYRRGDPALPRLELLKQAVFRHLLGPEE